MNDQMLTMLAVLDSIDDAEQREDLLVDMVSVLLMQVYNLQEFMHEHGLTEDDFNDYLDVFDDRTLH